MPQALHRHTPLLTAYDPRGLAICTVACHRRTAAQEPEARISRQVFGPSGFLTEQWDPRLVALRRKNPTTVPNQRNRSSLSGRLLRSDSVDRGVRISLAGAGGQLRFSWDARGTRSIWEYDELLRLNAVFEQGAGTEVAHCVERLTYADNSAVHARQNGCARLIRHDDPAGTLWFEGYDLLGQVTSQSRRFVRDASQAPNWSPQAGLREQHLESRSWRTQWRRDAVGQLVEQIDAQGNRQRMRHDVDGLLAAVMVNLGSGRQHSVVQQRSYNASGQIEVERSGNGVVRALAYSPLDDRLQQLKTWRTSNPGEALQDLNYVYDRVGNVLNIRDAAQPVLWSDNTRLQALSTYTYDSLYQLIEATGRENASNLNGPQLPVAAGLGAANGQRMRNYRQSYTYDAGGNLALLQHMPSHGSGYTRQMNVADHSNHGLEQKSGLPARPGLASGFDANGNQQVLEPGQWLSWTLRNQLQRVTRVTRQDGANDDEAYVYDSSGARALKIRQSHGHRQTRREEVYYLPGLEVRRNSATGEWLNVLTVAGDLNSASILQWEKGRPESIDNEHMRLSLSDHLGCSMLELDGSGRLLSQESYYPYGATAWWATKNTLEARYKFIRYSGKERDASGLYYYGMRYYAPWLARWISADPGDDIDGMNLYAMALGNPVGRVDEQGLLSSEAAIGRFAGLHSAISGLSRQIRSRWQASSAAAIRDGLATWISNVVGVGVDLALFEGRQPTHGLNVALRSTVNAIDALAVMHMGTGLFANLTHWSPFIGFIAANVTHRGFEMRGASEGAGSDEVWDPVARVRLAGHVRSLTREVLQQTLRGYGDSVSWGQTPVSSRVMRTMMSAGAYGLATVPNAVYGQFVPGPLQPNIAPVIEAYDGAAGTYIRAGHQSAQLDRHVNTLQIPPGMATFHGGMSRMFNQTWVYWAGVGIEAIAAYVTGSPIAQQSSRARAWVGAAKGAVSALTEVRGLLLQTARSGYNSLFKRWRPVKH